MDQRWQVSWGHPQVAEPRRVGRTLCSGSWRGRGAQIVTKLRADKEFSPRGDGAASNGLRQGSGWINRYRVDYCEPEEALPDARG